MSRREICDELAAAGCTTVGFEWNVDELVERAWSLWKQHGSPRNALVIVERDLAAGVELVTVKGSAEVQCYPVLE